jgi:hypothetical protein
MFIFISKLQKALQFERQAMQQLSKKQYHSGSCQYEYEMNE